MFVISMAGLSSRFFKAGYNVPKYQLELFGKSVFWHALSSFKNYFETDLFVVILRDVYRSKIFVKEQMEILGIKKYIIKVLEYETKGQAETVYLGIKDLANFKSEPVYIFNIDTFRYYFEKPEFTNVCDGYLEVFKGEGNHWSFVEPLDGLRVGRTTEKDRISDLCSDGLYYFASLDLFIGLFEQALLENLYIKGELYIAPMYNLLIKKNLDIRYSLISLGEIDFCGTPDEYRNLQTNGLKH